MLVSWSLTSLFSTNTAIAETTWPQVTGTENFGMDLSFLRYASGRTDRHTRSSQYFVPVPDEGGGRNVRAEQF